MASKIPSAGAAFTTPHRYSRADTWLFWTIAAYFVMNGAQLWETAIITPAWTRSPPASLLLFRAPYSLDFKYFWITIHSVHEIIFVAALVFNWRTPRRRYLLLLFLAHLGVRIWTLAYFAPVIIEFQQLPASEEVTSNLVARAARWRNLNYLRVGLFFSINLALVFLLRYVPVAAHRVTKHRRIVGAEIR